MRKYHNHLNSQLPSCNALNSCDSSSFNPRNCDLRRRMSSLLASGISWDWFPGTTFWFPALNLREVSSAMKDKSSLGISFECGAIIPGKVFQLGGGGGIDGNGGGGSKSSDTSTTEGIAGGVDGGDDHWEDYKNKN